MKKLIYLWLSLVVSFVLSYLISSFRFIKDITADTYRGFYLFIICFVGLIFVLSLQKAYKKMVQIMTKSPKIVNVISFSSLTFLFFLGVYNLIRIFFFIQVDYMSKGWSQTLEILSYQNKLFVITSYIVLFVLLLIYLFTYLSKIKKNTTYKSTIQSFTYSILGLMIFWLIVLMIKVLFYIILWVTVGISVD